MSRREEYEMKTEALITPIVDEKGFELVDVEYVKEGSNWYLRAYVDKKGGITINDLESVSRILSDKLDEEDFISDEIENYNSSLYYSNPDYIRCSYEAGEILD